MVESNDNIDTSTWKCNYVLVPVDKLRVVKVFHEVVEWEATFCSEDAIPIRARLGRGVYAWSSREPY